MAPKMNKQIALIAFTILFLLGMASAAWAAKLINGVTLDAPTSDPGITEGATFGMQGTSTDDGGTGSRGDLSLYLTWLPHSDDSAFRQSSAHARAGQCL